MLIAGALGAGLASAAGVPNVNVSQRHGNESEESIAINPTNPNNIVVVTNFSHREGLGSSACSRA
jgi:hypothetical protein